MSNYIIHYAIPYYDPVKAHEYYMQHRELKGYSKSKLNDKGKEAYEYVKNQLTTEKKSNIDKSKQETQQDIETYKSQTQGKIDALKTKLSQMSARDKRIRGNQIKQEISLLRENNAKKRAELNARHQSNVQTYNEKYNTDFNNELEKLFNDKDMLKTSTTKSKTSSKNQSYYSVPNKSLEEIKALRKKSKK